MSEWNPDNWQAAQQSLKKKSRLRLYRTDAEVVRSYKPACSGTVSERGNIVGAPSKRSLQRLVFLLNNCDVPMTSMLTITLAPAVAAMEPQYHNAMLKASLQKLRRDGVNQYCWVREHQANGNPHWHIFNDCKITTDEEVDKELSKKWCNYVCDYYHKHGIGTVTLMAMRNGDGKDFIGCCRFERLRESAAGRYAGKEGGKRFQKIPPEHWRYGGAWWRASRNVACTPIKEIEVDSSTIETVTCMINGKEREVALRTQFSRGLKEL